MIASTQQSTIYTNKKIIYAYRTQNSCVNTNHPHTRREHNIIFKNIIFTTPKLIKELHNPSSSPLAVVHNVCLLSQGNQNIKREQNKPNPPERQCAHLYENGSIEYQRGHHSIERFVSKGKKDKAKSVFLPFVICAHDSFCFHATMNNNTDHLHTHKTIYIYYVKFYCNI